LAISFCVIPNSAGDCGCAFSFVSRSTQDRGISRLNSIEERQLAYQTTGKR